MSFWSRMATRKRLTALPTNPAHLSMPGWDLVSHEPLAAYWRDAVGDVASLTLARHDAAFPSLSDTGKLQEYCRRVAQLQGAGLIEVATLIGAEGPCVTYIYKRVGTPALTFFGVATTPIPGHRWVWMVVAYERGVTGIREAFVTDKLLEVGELTVESYEASWAQDPYSPSYQGVDRVTLRNCSDAPEYDAAFPDHPLTKVRRELRRLPTITLASVAVA